MSDNIRVSNKMRVIIDTFKNNYSNVFISSRSDAEIINFIVEDWALQHFNDWEWNKVKHT